jgi:hypothetical protein
MIPGIALGGLLAFLVLILQDLASLIRWMIKKIKALLDG